MDILTTRFGRLNIDEQRIISFSRGLLGFGEQTQFALIQPNADSCFYWLQSVDDAELAFVLVDPQLFFKDYTVPIKGETAEELGLTDLSSALVLVICNRVEEWLTGNLLGPVVINTEQRTGQQIVLTEKRWTTRQPLMKLQGEVRLKKSA
jgi:flagellar assembly factor FliW